MATVLGAVSLGCRTSVASRLDEDAGTFTPAHASFAAAVRDFFGRHPDPVQPIDFPHNIHSDIGVTCTECHATVAQGPRAGIPGVTTCLTCHEPMGLEHPILKQVARWRDQGLDVSWQRVYGYRAGAHIRFNHAPHVRARVPCETCHGAIAQQTVATRNVDLTMGFCVSCHRARHASDDCLVCHY